MFVIFYLFHSGDLTPQGGSAPPSWGTPAVDRALHYATRLVGCMAYPDILSALGWHESESVDATLTPH